MPQIAEGGVNATVLLVEDQASLRMIVAEYLRELGYSVIEAVDGPGALRVLQVSDSRRVDLLVTDVGLPNGLNGRQLADMARVRRPYLPVVFVTGDVDSVLESFLDPGMAVIGKPFSFDVLESTIGSMLAVEFVG